MYLHFQRLSKISLLQPRFCFEKTHDSTQTNGVKQFTFSLHRTWDQSTNQSKPIMMGCIASRPVRSRPRSRAIRITLRLGARLSKTLSWLKDRLPSHSVKTYPTLSEPAPHMPEIPPSVAKCLCEDQTDRYDWAYAEMTRPKSERMRRQSAPETPTLSRVNSNVPAVDAENGEMLSGDPFLFL